MLIWINAQEVNLDWKLHDVGQVKQLITNMGTLWRASTNYPGLIYSEYPRNSFEEHVGEGGIWVGAVVGNDTAVSVTSSWNSSFEFFPTAELYDSVWAVFRGDSANLPYWQNYVGISDQDLICRYNDYGPASLRITNHKPLNIDVIQQSFAWGSPPVDEFIVLNFFVIPNKYDLKDTFIAYWLDGNVGYRGEGWGFALDDYTVYYRDLKMGVSRDAQGGTDGTAFSPIGTKIIPPKDIPEDSLKWTFNWYPGQGLGSPPQLDIDRYKQMASGRIMENQQEPLGSQYMISFGPIDINVGDTLNFQVALVFGEGNEGILETEQTVSWLIGQNYQVPKPPPTPPLRVENRNKEVLLSWVAQPGDINPETYTDPYRMDTTSQPFEGYRVYKSTESISGPWTLLAEYDVINDIGYNDGLQREYLDSGLLNNLEYYYAVTAYSKADTMLGFPSQESSVFRSAVTVVPGTPPPSTVGEVAVVPNPYRGDIAYYSYDPPWERSDATRDRWMEQDRRIQFINLPAQCEIKIYTIAGDLVNILEHRDALRGYEDWNLTSRVGQAVASGIYLFTVEDKISGDVQVGKFVIIK